MGAYYRGRGGMGVLSTNVLNTYIYIYWLHYNYNVTFLCN